LGYNPPYEVFQRKNEVLVELTTDALDLISKKKKKIDRKTVALLRWKKTPLKTSKQKLLAHSKIFSYPYAPLYNYILTSPLPLLLKT